MPDDAATTTATAPSAPAPGPSSEPANAPPPQPTAPDGAAAHEQASTPNPPAPVSDEERRRWLAELDPKEIARLNRKFANLVGNEADRLARQRVEAQRSAWQAEQARAREADELRRLRDENPAEYVEREKEMERRYAQLMQAEQRFQQARQAEWQGFDRMLQAFHQHLPEPVRTALDGQTFDLGDPLLSREAYLKEVSNKLADHGRKSGVAAELEKEKARLTREIEEGIRREIAARENSADPSLDLGSGGAQPQGPMTQDEFDRHAKHNRAYRMQHRARFEAGVAQGFITRS